MFCKCKLFKKILCTSDSPKNTSNMADSLEFKTQPKSGSKTNKKSKVSTNKVRIRRNSENATTLSAVHAPICEVVAKNLNSGLEKLEEDNKNNSDDWDIVEEVKDTSVKLGDLSFDRNASSLRKQLEKRRSFSESEPIFNKPKPRKDSIAAFGSAFRGGTKNSFQERMNKLRSQSGGNSGQFQQKRSVNSYNCRKDESMVRDEEQKLAQARLDAITKRKNSTTELEGRRSSILEKLQGKVLSKTGNK